MPSPFFGLPPGIYHIQSSGKNVVNPGTNENQLFVACPTDKLNQQWLIRGDGSISAMDVGTWAYAELDIQSGSPVKINRSDTKNVLWIIQVVKNSADDSFTGGIMTSDITKRYWGLDGNDVQLDETLTSLWTFIPANMHVKALDDLFREDVTSSDEKLTEMTEGSIDVKNLNQGMRSTGSSIQQVRHPRALQERKPGNISVQVTVKL